jgi:xanthine dehydrogenase D subunit
MSVTRTEPQPAVAPLVGENAPRPDGTLKVKGEFAYSSDLWADGMLWGATVRSPHPHARIRSIDTRAAARVQGVRAVLTHADVPGRRTYGLHVPDQPVLAWDVVRYEGEPVALVAADEPETARRAAALVQVDYELLEPLTDPEAALRPGGPQIGASGNVIRRIEIGHGDLEVARREADVVVTGEYEIGMQDQAFLGPESGLAMPAADGGIDLYVATQWVHVDRDQVAASLALDPALVRVTLAGVGGAFGGREDLSMQIHSCLLALRTGRAVKMSYSREESFYGHVHRHPARLRYEHGARSDGRLAFVSARILFDGGAYVSTSDAVIATAASFAAGPYEAPVVAIDASVVHTHNPPCGAMRGFGAVQACFGYESQMDRLAAALGMDPVELRLRNAMRPGSRLPSGQALPEPAPVRELLERLQAMPLPAGSDAARDLRELPGGVGNTTHGESVRRGVGYAIGFKNVGFGEGAPDYSTARVRLLLAGGEPLVEVHTAAVEVGQGIVAVQAQVARTELAVERVVVLPADTAVGSAGSSSASRQTWMTGGAVKAACAAVRAAVLAHAGELIDRDPEELVLGASGVTDTGGTPVVSWDELLAAGPVQATREYHRPRRTGPIDSGRDVHMAFSFAAHRAVVDVDPELGLVRVVELATVQDVGKAINPKGVEGQIHGGCAQGLGLALMEEVIVQDGRVRNPSFTDYLIPTVLDMPPVRMEVLELEQPDAPYGVNGVGEAPTIASTPAIVAAVRAASGRALRRIPIRPEHIAGVEA